MTVHHLMHESRYMYLHAGRLDALALSELGKHVRMCEFILCGALRRAENMWNIKT